MARAQGSWIGREFCGIALLVLAGCGEARSSRAEGSAGNANLTAGAPGEGTDGGRLGSAGAPREPSAGNGGQGGRAPFAFECDRVPVTTQLRRLAPAEYDRTVRELLGVTALEAGGREPPSSVLPPAHEGPIVDADFRGFMDAAEAIAAQVVRDDALLARFFACAPEGPESPCFHETIVKFGRRAFRRPLTDAEVARFERLVQEGAAITEAGSVKEIAEVLLIAFLASPSFLQHTELSEKLVDTQTCFALTPHQIAARLSYMLWGSMPDAELDRVADSGELRTQDELLRQALRMLEDEKARDMIREFHRAYVRNVDRRRWEETTKDAALFPEFNERVVPAMIEEMDRFFESVVLGGGSFPELFLSPRAFVNADTAPIYGLDPRAYGPELEEVLLDQEARPGFLTRVGFLASHAERNRTSPIQRGAFVMIDVLGIDPGAPIPEGVTTPLPSSASLDTNRKRVMRQTAEAPCKNCHWPYLNPPGFVLEAYDAIGRLQTTEADTGAPIDTAADVFLDTGTVSVDGPYSLMKALASSPRAQYRYVQQLVSHAYGRPANGYDAEVVSILSARLAGGDYPILRLIAELTQPDSFRFRARGEP